MVGTQYVRRYMYSGSWYTEILSPSRGWMGTYVKD